MPSAAFHGIASLWMTAQITRYSQMHCSINIVPRRKITNRRIVEFQLNFMNFSRGRIGVSPDAWRLLIHVTLTVWIQQGYRNTHTFWMVFSNGFVSDCGFYALSKRSCSFDSQVSSKCTVISCFHTEQITVSIPSGFDQLVMRNKSHLKMDCAWHLSSLLL